MASLVDNLDSNITGLRCAVEESPGKLPVTPVWIALDPNSYSDFGGEYTKKARNPINDSRQRSKGVTVDLKVSAGIAQDLTYNNGNLLLPHFLYAAPRTKSELAVSSITSGAYAPAAGGLGYHAGDLLFAKEFLDPRNNGLKTVTGSPTGTSIGTVETLADGAGNTGTISRVGFQFASGDLAVVVTNGALTALKSTAKDMTELGLVPGEFVWVGGDGAGTAFASTENFGRIRVRGVTADTITFDKADAAWIADAGTGRTIQIFFGRLVRNEARSLIKRTTLQFERTLGIPDMDLPTSEQAEYLTGAMPNDISFKWSIGDILAATMSWMPRRHETRLPADGLKTGARPALIEADGYNSADHLTRINISAVSEANSYANPLFAYVQDMSLSIKNNVAENKALGVLGAFSNSLGTFEVSGDMTVYFTTLEATAAARDNLDMSVDWHLAANNQGISFDLPLVSLGNSKVTVDQDKAIMLPVSYDAARGRKVQSDLDYTLAITFWDYLPNVAMP